MTRYLELSVPLFVFNEVEARTVDAIASRIFPADDRNGGAHEAEVVVYVDRTLAGHSRHLQAFYHDGLRELDDYCSGRFDAPFADLPEGEQDEVLESLDTRRVAQGELGQVAPPSSAEGGTTEASEALRTFFDVLWEHTIQGLFCDPAYGGNKDAIGWRAIGFPGAQWSYSQEQRTRGFDATSIPVRTLGDLQRERPWESTRTPGKD